ncbi:MAG: class I SAM-dependent methyltransferase [Candidatus Bathyarchaeia archaeon]
MLKWLAGGFGQFQFKRWLDKNASQVSSAVGVEEGKVVLDLGCGSGTYTIPAAKLVGDDGRVYALDVSRKALDRMEEKADREGLKNIVRIDASAGDNIPLDNETVDVMLLIDVLQEINDRYALFGEAYRILRQGGVVIVYPMHIQAEEVERLATSKGLDTEDRQFEGRILVFRKISQS